MKHLLFVFVLFLSGLSLRAQVFEFSFFEAPYEEITDSMSINGGLVWQDNDITIPIGFEWMIGDKVVDTIYAEDAYIGFLADGSASDDDLFDVTYVLAASYFFTDRALASGIPPGQPGSLSPLSYTLDGDEGDRIFKLQFKNLAFKEEIFEEVTPLSFCNLQIWIYERDNSLEYRYGPRTVYHPAIAYGGLSGWRGIIGLAPSINENNEMFNASTYLVSGDLSNPQINVLTDYQDDIIFVDSLPAEGIVYRFSPAPSSIFSVATSDVGQLKISPNPARESILLRDLGNGAISQVMAMDLSGRIVELPRVGNQVDISALLPGRYQIMILDEDGVVRQGSMTKL